MRDFIANFVRFFGICKDFVGNRVDEPRQWIADMMFFSLGLVLFQ